MNIVLDTNVLIAAFIAKGFSSKLVEYCLQSHLCITSEFILGELEEKLLIKFKYSDADVKLVLDLLRSRMLTVAVLPLKTPTCRDIDDDAVLATAIAGKAVCIVTGDKDLLVLKQFESVDIIHPSEFSDYENN
jgi:uncharacterized protein